MEFDPIADIAEARQDTESLMLDACTAARPGAVTTDQDGAVTRPMVPVYAGKCRLKQSATQPRETVAGEHEHAYQETRWDTPVGSGPFQIGDIVTMTAAAMDGQLVGRSYKVTGLFNQSAATAQRCTVEEVIA